MLDKPHIIVELSLIIDFLQIMSHPSRNKQNILIL